MSFLSFSRPPQFDNYQENLMRPVAGHFVSPVVNPGHHAVVKVDFRDYKIKSLKIRLLTWYHLAITSYRSFMPNMSAPAEGVGVLVGLYKADPGPVGCGGGLHSLCWQHAKFLFQ